MIFDNLDVRLISPDDTHYVEGAAASGSIAAFLVDAAANPITVPLCTGFLISRLHVLTAAHCVQSGLVFDQSHIVSSAEASSFEIVAYGQTVRLQIGGVSTSGRHHAAVPPALGAPSYQNVALDFAVLALSESTKSTFVDLSAIATTANGESDEAVRLYGFPNGVPLSEAFHCRTISAHLESTLLHDCDTLPGSSGGLLVSAASGIGVAMHVGSTSHNALSYFEETGHFESASSLQVKVCDSAAEAPASDPSCFEGPGYNRAVKLVAVVRDIQQRAPEVWSNIVDNSR